MPSEPWPPTPTNGTEGGRDGTAKPATRDAAPTPEAQAAIEPPSVAAEPAAEPPTPQPVEEPVTEARRG